MFKVPDIQDIDDITRFAKSSWYPYQRNSDGSCKSVAYIREKVDASHYSISVYTGEESENKIITFTQFLNLEQGYYRSRMVDFNGSVMYCQNLGADEAHRNHGWRYNSVRYQHHHPSITSGFASMNGAKCAPVVYSEYRRTYKEAIADLEEGRIVGCALSDNFGLITMESSPDILLVRRGRVVGTVIRNEPRLDSGCEHYYNAVTKLWR